MSTTSADPAKLHSFTSGVRTARQSSETEQMLVAGMQRAVAAASPDYHTEIPALTALATALVSMGANETFVSTVRSELLAADAYSSGQVSVPDSKISAALDAAGAATAPLPVQFEATTSVGLPPTSGFVDDPICAANGNMVHQDTDVQFPAIAGALNIVRTWNSLTAEHPGAFGAGSSSVLDVRLEVSPGVVRAHLADGAIIPFEESPAGWVARGRRGLQLAGYGDGWALRTDNVRTFRFDADGVLTGWDVGVARVAVSRDGDGKVVGLHEAVTGRSLAVAWSGGVVESLATDDGRTTSYVRDTDGRIVEARSHAGWLTYCWDDAMLVAVVDADGVAAFTNVYDDAGRVLEQTSPFGRVTIYRYDLTGMTVVAGDDGVRQAMVHDRRGNLTAVVDTDGTAMRLIYDSADRVVQVVERDGAEWHYEYDDRDDLVGRVDPDGLGHRWAWDEQRRLLTETDRAGNTWRREYDTEHQAPSRVFGPDGSVVSQVLDMRGLPLSITDADGVTTHHEWDTDGQLVATTDALGGRSALAFDEHGLLVRLVPAEGAATVLLRDGGGRVLRTERAAEVSTYRYTPAGRIDGGTEPGDIAWSATFGPHGAPAAISDATGATVVFGHDSLGNVTAITAPDGAVYANRFDGVGRHVATVEPTGATVTKGYDVRGRLVSFTDAEGRTWHRRVDSLGRTISSTAPDGAVTTWTYHPGGEVATVSGPDGRTWSAEVDHDGRPTAVVKPSGARAEIGYTNAGRVAWRRSPAGRTEHFEYDAAGRLIAIIGIDGTLRLIDRDLRGRIAAVSDLDGTVRLQWDDGYRLTGITDDDGSATITRDSAGSPVGSVDATGVTTQFEWDDRGLLASSADPAGLASRYERDVRGRLTAQITPGDRRIGVDWGHDGRLTAITDPAGAVTSFSRDRTGAITAVRHGDGSGWDRTLDAVGRELARTGTDGVEHASFGYDVAGRLTSAAVPGAGLSTTFLWDDDDRVAAVRTADGTATIERDADGWVVATTSEHGVRTLYERDAAGRIVSVRDGEGGTLAVPQDDAGERDRAGRLTIGSDGTVHRYDDAGRIAEIMPADVEPTRFTYGDDGLVAVETGVAGTRRFAYDAAGRVASVTLDGVGTTTIDYDPAGRRRREARPDGSVVTYGWDTAGRLSAVEGVAAGGDTLQTDVVYDAFGRPVVAGPTSFGYDAVTGRLCRIDDHRFIRVGAHTYDVDARRWEAPTPDRPAGGVLVDELWIIGARVLDPVTHQFLSPDPLLAVAGSNGAASAYTYAWHDPVNRVDPSGLRPISIEEFRAIREREEQGRLGQAWEAIKEDPWGTVAMVGVVAAGVGLMFVPGGQAIGVGILVGAAMSAGTGFATGNFSPTGLAVGGAFGAIPGGSTLRGAITIGAASGAGETVVTSALTGRGLPTGGELLFGTVTGGAGGAGSHGLTRLFPPSATPDLDHTPSAPQPGARFVTNSDGVTVDTLANPATNTVSLGHYPAYVELGQQTGARTFSMSDEAWNAMSPDEQWLRNSRFLDNAITRGDEFRLATPIDEVRPGSYYERELQHLAKHGYVPSDDGRSMVPG